MSSTLKQAIQALKSRVADAFAAVEAKGGTLPATQDTANLPAAIASIPAGGSGYYENLVQYGVPSACAALINGFLDPKLQESLPLGTKKNVPFVLTDGESWSGRGFAGYSNLLVAIGINGVFSGYISFYMCRKLEYIVIGEGMTVSFLDSGTAASGYYLFNSCTSLRAILGKPLVFPSIFTADISMSGCFYQCYALEEVYIDFQGSCSWNISDSPLKYECLIYLLEHLVEVTNSPRLTLGAKNRATLNATAEGAAALAAAQAKGWTIA